MPRDGAQTREKILQEAHRLALGRGFAATSLDRVIEAAGITKGAFFYHFSSRDELARALVRRYAAAEHDLVAELDAKAGRLSRDPLQQLLLFVGLFQEFIDAEDQPGCLFATFVNEMDITDEETTRVVREALMGTRDMMAAKLERVLEQYEPRVPIDVMVVADLFTAIFEGGFVLARTFEDDAMVAKQLGQYRTYLELLFDGAEARD